MSFKLDLEIDAGTVSAWRSRSENETWVTGVFAEGETLEQALDSATFTRTSDFGEHMGEFSIGELSGASYEYVENLIKEKLCHSNS